MALNRTRGGIDMPQDWVEHSALSFRTDAFEEDVRVERRRPDLDAVGVSPENMIQWCAMEDGEVLGGYEMLHDAFRHFEDDWVSPGEAALDRAGPKRA